MNENSLVLRKMTFVAASFLFYTILPSLGDILFFLKEKKSNLPALIFSYFQL